MMSSRDITDIIVSEISKLNIGKVKASPLAVIVLDYDMFESICETLVWFDQAFGYQGATSSQSGRPIAGASIKKNLRYVVSVGYRTMENLSRLDEIVENIEMNIANIVPGDASVMIPSSISRIIPGTNNVYWRQIWFDTSLKLSIPSRNIT